jgi:ABC-type branched-subunit amino acid transport system substrate-binding protein
MSRSKKSLEGSLLVCLLLVVLAGCGSKGSENKPSSGGGGASGAVKTGPGVTGKTITLGVLTDLSGVFAPLGKPTMQANQLFWKERNAQGGVCGRTVRLVVKDHGYDPQKAVVQYRELSGQVAGLQELLGSPITAALLPSLKSDQMLSLLAAWPSSLLPNDNIIITGTTYDVEMINGLDYLLQQGKIKKGDKIGHLYFEGEYGENGLKGSKYFAQKNGMTIVEQKIKATDEDMSGQVAAFKRAGVKAAGGGRVMSPPPPTQLASVAGIAAAQGLKVPLVGNNPTFDPALLKTPAAKALRANAYIVSSIAPYNLDKPDVQKVASDYSEAYPKEVPKASAPFGYMQSRLMYEILNQACRNKDLTREGLVKAAHQLKNVDTGGLTAAPLSYTSLGQPSERAVYIAQPANVAGGLQALPRTFESDTAKRYQVGGT